MSGLACPGPGAVSAGAGAVLVLLLSVYTLSPLVTLPLPVNPCGVSSIRQPPFVFPSLRLPFCYFLSIQAERARRFRFCYTFLCFISVFLRICSVILCFLADLLCYSLLLSVG